MTSRRNFREITSVRLRLRSLVPNDLDAVHRPCTDPEVRKYLWDDEIVSRGKAESVLTGNAECFENHGFGIWAVLRREDREMIGFCGFRFLDETHEVELLYGVASRYWGIGLAPEASRAAIRYAFEEAGLQRILGIIDSENLAFRRVLEKIGMRFEKRTSREAKEEVRYVILREEFQPDDAPYVVRCARQTNRSAAHAADLDRHVY